MYGNSGKIIADSKCSRSSCGAQICSFYASLLQVSLHMHRSLLTCMEMAAKIISDSKCSNSGFGTQLFLVYMSLLQVSFHIHWSLLTCLKMAA